MADVTSLELFKPDTTGPWDPTKPVQAWHDPQAAAAVAAMPSLATLPKTYTTWSVDTVTGAVTFPTISTTLGQAAVQNVPPPGFTSVPGNSAIPPVSNPPIDLSKLPAGYQVQSNVGPLAAFGGLPQLVPVVAPPAPAPPGTDPTEARVLAGIEEILQQDKLPLV